MPDPQVPTFDILRYIVDCHDRKMECILEMHSLLDIDDFYDYLTIKIENSPEYANFGGQDAEVYSNMFMPQLVVKIKKGCVRKVKSLLDLEKL